MKRTYKVSKKKIQSACVAAWKNKRSKNMLFVTFTFPFDINEDKAARVWNLLLKSLYSTYNIRNYVWVKEKQPKNNDRLHYHIIIDTGHITIKALQESYNSAIRNVFPNCDLFNNSVRLGNRPVVYSVKAVSKYLSKYVSKTDNRFERRASGWSELKLYSDLKSEELAYLVSFMQISVDIIAVEEPYNVYFLNNLPEKLFSPPGSFPKTPEAIRILNEILS